MSQQLMFDPGPPARPNRIGERWESTHPYHPPECPPLEVIGEEWRPYEWGEEELDGEPGYHVWVCAGVNIFGEPYEIRLTDSGLRKEHKRVGR